MKSFVLLWSAWSHLDCEEFYAFMACQDLCGMWRVLCSYSLPGLMWNARSFTLSWPARSHVECGKFYTVMACLVSCGMWKVLYCYGLPGFMWNGKGYILFLCGAGIVVVCYSPELGELWSIIL